MIFLNLILQSYDLIPLKTSALGFSNENKPLNVVVVVGASFSGMLSACQISWISEHVPH